MTTTTPFIHVQRFGKTVLRCGQCGGPAMLEPSEGGVIPPRVVCLHCGRTQWGAGVYEHLLHVDTAKVERVSSTLRTERRGRPRKAVAS